MVTPGSQEVRFEGVHCTLAVKLFPGGVVVMTIRGTDVGEFGEAPMLEVQKCIDAAGPIQLFVDARDVRGASIEVSGDWGEWMRARQGQLRGISMLTGSRYVEVTADFVRRFAGLQGKMRIYTEAAAFDAALEGWFTQG
jgi:hypothetical protein